MGGNGRRHVGPCACDEIGGVGRGDVFKHDLEPGEPLNQWRQGAGNKHRFAIENIDVRVRDLPVHQQGDAGLFHAFQHAQHICHIGDTFGRICRGARGIQFDA